LYPQKYPLKEAPNPPLFVQTGVFFLSLISPNFTSSPIREILGIPLLKYPYWSFLLGVLPFEISLLEILIRPLIRDPLWGCSLGNIRGVARVYVWGTLNYVYEWLPQPLAPP